MKWIKQMFGIKEEEPGLPNDSRFTDATVTNELVISANSVNTSDVKNHTTNTLAKYTKVQLEELARGEYGLELDRRKKKDELIAEILNAQ